MDLTAIVDALRPYWVVWLMAIFLGIIAWLRDIASTCWPRPKRIHRQQQCDIIGPIVGTFQPPVCGYNTRPGRPGCRRRIEEEICK